VRACMRVYRHTHTHIYTYINTHIYVQPYTCCVNYQSGFALNPARRKERQRRRHILRRSQPGSLLVREEGDISIANTYSDFTFRPA